MSGVQMPARPGSATTIGRAAGALRGRVVRVASLLLLALAAGCSGDVDPLEEAIEVRDLDLVSLSIVRPEGTLRPLVINRGERLRFGLEGSDSTGGAFDVDAAGRPWRVSDPAVASIDANGELVGLADGDVIVDVRIGDIAAQGEDVEVSTAALASIARVVGTDLVDPCVPERYVAYGMFADGTERLLQGATWTSRSSGTELVPLEDGSVELSAARPGLIELVATFNEARLGREIVVNDSLRGLTVGPSGALTARVGATLQLSASGRYGETDAVGVEEVVTSTVRWEITAGADVASVGNEPATRGLLAAQSVGEASVRAVCGDVVSESRPVNVGPVSSTDPSDDGALAFLGASGARGDGDGGELTLNLSRIGGNQVRLRVSTGSSFDEDTEITNDPGTRWEVVGGDEFPIGTVDDGLDKGLLILTGTGRLQVRVTYRGRAATLDIDVTN